MKLTPHLLVVALVAFAPGTIRAVNPDPETTDVQVTYNAEIAPSVYVHTSNGQVSKIILLPSGQAMKIVRDSANTLPWSEQISTDGVTASVEYDMTQATINGSTTCCKTACSSFNRFDFQQHDCFLGGNDCEICTVTCTGGWVNCPVGTKKVLTFYE